MDLKAARCRVFVVTTCASSRGLVLSLLLPLEAEALRGLPFPVPAPPLRIAAASCLALTPNMDL